MVDQLTPVQRSENMRRIKSKDTKPEMLIRKALHKRGYRFRLHVKSLPGKPDIVLPKYKTIIEVRGCFWHGHICHRGNRPRSNESYWNSKIHYNIERDEHTINALQALGWHVIIIWECECTNPQKLQLKIDELSGILI